MLRSRLLGGSLLLLSLNARALGESATRPPALELPITDVTVFSDRARVTRRGDVRVEHGPHTLTLPRLPETADPSSVRVEATGARITRVAVRHVTRDALPRTEAQKLIDHLQSLRDEVTALTDHLDTLQNESRFLDSIRPHGEPLGADKLPPLLLNATGWSAALEFFDARSMAIATAEADLSEKLRSKQKEIVTAEAEARQLLGQGGDESGYIVDAAVDGAGATAHLSFTYVAAGAQWYPAYDVRYTPGEKTVEVGFSGLVAQGTGENWTDARLTLSTAVPASVTNLPKLAVWKIGDRERFIPTPEAATQETTIAPSGSPVATPEKPAEDQPPDLRDQLEAAVGSTASAAGNAAAEEQSRLQESRYREEAAESTKTRALMQRRAQMDMAASAPPPMPPPPPPARAPAPMMMAAQSVVRAESYSTNIPVMQSPPTRSVSFGAPMGWMPPAMAGDLPAMLAGGYEFTYVSAQAESIRTGAEARRVPLFTQSFPAESWIKIMPALSHSAYLVAEVTNTGATPWLQGRAHLFVGADLVGDASVPTTAPGEKVTLPLGIDDAIKVDRNVQVVSTERGVFSKQDVSAYQVVIELLNTRKTTVAVRVFDQISLPHQKEVEIALTKTDPPPWKDDKALKEEGHLEWRLDLSAGQKRSVGFTYEVARPKGWKLWQTSTPGVSP